MILFLLKYFYLIFFLSFIIHLKRRMSFYTMKFNFYLTNFVLRHFLFNKIFFGALVLNKNLIKKNILMTSMNLFLTNLFHIKNSKFFFIINQFINQAAFLKFFHFFVNQNNIPLEP